MFERFVVGRHDSYEVYATSPYIDDSSTRFFWRLNPYEIVDRSQIETIGSIVWLNPPVPVPDIEVPPVGAPWVDISPFALTYNAYARDGGPEKLRRRGDVALGKWIRSGELPKELSELRSLLFFEQRWVWHQEEGMSDAFERVGYREFIDALLERINDMSGGTLPGPPDPNP